MLSFDSSVSTEVHGLSFSFLSPNDIRSLSTSEIKNVGKSGHEASGKACIYDPSLGSTELYRLCATCNETSNCDGHLGHINFAVPLYHPMMLNSLCKFLKTICFFCGRIKFNTLKLTKYMRLFEMCQIGMIEDLILFDQILNSDPESDEEYKKNDVYAEYRDDVIKSILCKLKRRRKERMSRTPRNRVPLFNDTDMKHEFSMWNELRNRFFNQGSQLNQCSYCASKGKFLIKPSSDLSHIEVSWSQSSIQPNLIKSFREFIDSPNGPNIQSPTNDGEATSDSVKKEVEIYNDKMFQLVNKLNSDIELSPSKSLNTTGKSVNTVHLQSFHLIPYMDHIFRNYSRPLSHIFPQSRLHGYKIFFMDCMGVSANRFRPPLVTSDKQIVLHSRSSSLLDIIIPNELVKLLLQFKYSNKEEFEGNENNEYGKEVKHEPKSRSKKKGLTEYLYNMEYKIDENQLEQFENYLKECNDLNENIRNQILNLQKKLSLYMDSGNPRPGLKQTLEKKEGTVRQNMLGKRVNYSARTVIAPDCFIDTNQMGMPLKFALELTVPEYVTKYNVNFLRRLVVNGPKVYPGAKLLRDTNGKIYNLGALSYNERVAKAKLLLVGLSEGNGSKIVYRHVLDGDVVLMNRQPTLHKPGIMAHFVKVLTNQKTFRLNYVNCSTYNADFDGDEMNVHLPQDHLSQSEAQLIANADCQFVVPKNGQPIRGLIQDHCQGGALLTSRDTFFTKSEFFNLVHLSVNSFISTNSTIYLNKQDIHQVEEDIKLDLQLHQMAKRLKILSDPFARKITNRNIRIYLDLPAILYPKQLYTGKQVITCVLKTLIDNISLGSGGMDNEKKYRGINLNSKSQTPGDAWGGCYDGDKEESTIVIRNSELLQGVLDKSQFGASTYGLTHLIYELLGPRVCGMLLNSFSYLFTAFLQMRGATCSPKDFLLTETAESQRIKILKRIKYAGLHLQELFMSLSRNTNSHIGNDNLVESEGNLLSELVSDFKQFYYQVKDLVEVVSDEEVEKCNSFSEFFTLLSKVFTSLSKGNIDTRVEELMNNYSSKLIESSCKLPKMRNLLLHHFSNISSDSNLNQVELNFPTWLGQHGDGDKPEGNVTQNGEREKLGHNMFSTSTGLVGNGIVDGNKMMNGGSCYKLGDSYNTCLKFYSMICNSPRGSDILNTFDRFFQNNIVGVSSDINELVDKTVVKFPRNGFATMVSTGAKGSKVNFAMISCALSQQTLEGKRVPVMLSVRTLPCFAFGDFGSRAGGFITDRFLTGLRPQEYFFHCMSGREGLVDTCVKTAKSGYLQRCVLKSMEDVIVCYDSTVRDSNSNIIQFKYGEDGVDVCKSSYLSKLQDLQLNHRCKSVEQDTKTGLNDNLMDLDDVNGVNDLEDIDTESSNLYQQACSSFQRYYERCKCEPGDAVGCIAGQSIGEPATQMTLNTFHLAGHGATNVTLGIPRLVEILQNTSHCSTPFFSAPILGENEDEIAQNAESAINALRKVFLSDLVSSVGIESNVYVNGNSEKEWEYVATVQFEDLQLFKDVMGHFETQDLLKLCSNALLSSFMKRVMGQLIVTMDVNVPFELVDKTDQLEEFWNMFVMQKQILKRDKLSTRIRKMTLFSGSSANIPQTNDHDDIINIQSEPVGDGEREGEEQENEDEEKEESETETESSDEESEEEESHSEYGDEDYSDGSFSSSEKYEENEMDLDKDEDFETGDLEEHGTPRDIDEDKLPRMTSGEGGGIKFRKQNVASINRKVFQFVKSVDFLKETSTLVLKFGWPFSKCPYYLDLLPLLKQEISHQVLRDTPGIRQSRIVFNNVGEREEFTLHCDGTNLKMLFMLREDIVDFNRLKMNDVLTVLKYYGIEAARSCIVSELQKVFSVYGIKVDYRHLTLIADFMTQNGDIRTFTRYGMAKHTSPLLQMSFESTMKFLMNASERGAYDNLKSPAGALMAGKPVHVGSSLCGLMHIVDLKDRSKEKMNVFGGTYDL